MRKYLICTILFSHLIVCSGCGSEQKKSDSINTANIQKSESMSIIIDKSNLQKEEILSWDYNQALAKLGDPVSQRDFPTTRISKFSIGLRRYLPADTVIQVKELSFATDSITNLTIWYIEKDKKWEPVHFMKWHKDKQF